MKIYLGLIAAAALTLTACGDNKPAPPHLKPQPLLWLPHLKLLLHLLLLHLLPHQELRLLPLQPQLPLPQPLVANAKPLS